MIFNIGFTNFISKAKVKVCVWSKIVKSVLFYFLTAQVLGTTDLVVSGRRELVSVAVKQKGGQTDKMTHSKIGQLLNRQTKEHLTDLCVMAFLIVHLGMSVLVFVEGHVDPTVEDLRTDRKEQGLMNSQWNEASMAAIVHRVEVDIVGGEVTVLVLESALKEQMQMMAMARNVAVLMSDIEWTHQISREIEAVLMNGKNDKDLMKTWNDPDLMTEEVDENLFVVAEVVDVDLVVEVEEVLIDLERETTIDILKGMFFLLFSSYITFCLYRFTYL